MLKRLDHVGVIVDHLQEACRLLEAMGMQHDRDLELPGRLRSSFYTCGQTQIEVIEIREPNERAMRLGSDKARVEHIAIEVDDLANTLETLATLGVQTQAVDPIKIGTSLNSWTVADSSDGVVYQLIERQ